MTITGSEISGGHNFTFLEPGKLYRLSLLSFQQRLIYSEISFQRTMGVLNPEQVFMFLKVGPSMEFGCGFESSDIRFTWIRVLVNEFYGWMTCSKMDVFTKVED